MANSNSLLPSVNAVEKQFIQADQQSRLGFVIKGETFIKLTMSGNHYFYGQDDDFVITSAAERLDSGNALEPGRDYYIYLCYKTANASEIIVSLNSTFPTGYDADSSRKIGGFHTLCVAAGDIVDHPLSDYDAGDILPQSIWCLSHRPKGAGPEGMVYIEPLDLWVDIYLQSGTGSLTKSVYGATITDTRVYLDFVDDLAAVGKSLLHDEEFQIAAEGSNQQTNISGSTDPVTTGGHKDTKGRRMISNYGLEDCCGAFWQWVTGGGWEYGNAGVYSGTWATNWPGGKGSVHRTSGRSAMVVGGGYGTGSYCGSRSRLANYVRSSTYDNTGGRGRARNL